MQQRRRLHNRALKELVIAPRRFKLARFAAPAQPSRPIPMSTLLHPPLPSTDQRHWRWRELHGSARALALAEAVLADTRPWVFIIADTRELEQLAAELRFFAGNELDRPDPRPTSAQ